MFQYEGTKYAQLVGWVNIRYSVTGLTGSPIGCCKATLLLFSHAFFLYRTVVKIYSVFLLLHSGSNVIALVLILYGVVNRIAKVNSEKFQFLTQRE